MYEYFMGIDISKDSFDIALLESEKVKLSIKLSMDKEGFDTLIKHLSSLNKDKLLISMEATGIYHMPLLCFLIENGFKCTVTNPLLISKFIASSTLRKTKNDKKDAYLIALFASKSYNSLRLADINTFNDIRVLVRERESLCCEINKLKTNIKVSLTQLFPELQKSTNIFTQGILNLLLEVPSARAVRKLKQKVLARILGRKITISAQEILTLANNSIAIINIPLEKVLTSQIRRLLIVQDEIEMLDKELEEFLQGNQDINNDIQNIESIPGIGKITSKSFVIEIADINRFDTHKQLSAFAGLDPALKQSGISLNSNGRISKRGNSSLRRLLYLMAIGVIRYCDKFRAYFKKKIDEGKKYKQAVIAVANKLLRTLFVLLKNKTKFDPNLA
ncbi:MAG: IS110 family transposase [Campylobacteraceae bacterium]|jgi:transposase|nr:IS110 family transposase [Campylobacteraceae bacterium]